MTRQEAIQHGSKTYDGKPCNYSACGRTERYVNGYGCVWCHKFRAITSHDNGRDKKRSQLYKTKGMPQPDRSMTDACEICNQPETSKHVSGCSKSLALDHSHTTGKFREWLCNRCNHLIGLAGDDIELLTKAIAYLNLNSL